MRRISIKEISLDFIEDIKSLATRIGPEIDKLSFAETQHLIRILVTKIELIINDDPQIYIKDIRIGGQ